MNKEAFVYLWKNKISGRRYIGYHKGSQDDGYISSTSNQNFWKDLELGELEREILFEGATNECLKYEQDYLKKIDLRSDEWYNNARGAEIIFTQEVRDKIRNHHLGKPSGMLGKNHSEETKEKIKDSTKKIMHGNEWNKKVSIALRGKKKSDKHKKNMLGSHGDMKIYSFLNVHTNENYTGTRAEFSKKYNIARHNIVGLVHKKTKILANTWILLD
jgi:hypothetical protein